jgi:branched-chain amino acid transport system permease protein
VTHRQRFLPLFTGVPVLVLLLLARVSLGPHDMVRGFDLLLLVTMATSWNLVGGFGGLFSVGHSMFVGTGSYAAAMLIVKADLPLGVTLALAGVITALLSGIVALPLMRLRAAYFSVASLGIAVAAQSWMLNWDWTGASTGLNLPLSSYVQPKDQYLLAVGLTSVAVSVVVLVVRGGLGLRLMALRDDEDAAAHIGIRRLPVALTNWMISGFLTGMAGALIALQKSSLEPVSAFSLAFTLDMIVASVLGGLGTLVGPILGAIVVYAVRQLLQDSQNWATFINGVLIVFAIRFAPRGIWGLLVDSSRFFRHRLAARRSNFTPQPSFRAAEPAERTVT